MHFAMPPRKTSRPPPYAARQNSGLRIPPALKNLLRRDKLRVVVLGLLAFLTVFWLLGRVGGGSKSSVPSLRKVAIGSGAPVVIVTVLDPNANIEWTEKIKQNREVYAKKHGYKTFFPYNDQYPLRNSPTTWARVPATRHAITKYPGASWFWYLDQTALITNFANPIHSSLLTPSKLEASMISNAPVVPPDSVIKTFSNLKGERIDLVVTQDKDGLAPSSFIIRNGEWAKYFLDVWFDPIYRSYNFQKAEYHALEHIVQWHGTILAKLAMVPQNLINAYTAGPASLHNGQFKNGDLVANFPGCDKDENRDCAREQQPFFEAMAAA